MARAAVADILARGRLPLLVGGSGLYFRAVVDPLEFPGTDPVVRGRLEREAVEQGAMALYERLEAADPEAAVHIHPFNARRTIRALEVLEVTGRPFSSFRTSWEQPRSLYALTVVGLTEPRPELGRRIDARVESQLARGLVAEVERLVREERLRDSATAVQALGYAQILQEAIEQAKARTRRFARRQTGWFRADSRVTWFTSDATGAAAHLLAHRSPKKGEAA